MVYAIAFPADEYEAIDWQLECDQSMTKTLGMPQRTRDPSPRITLVFARGGESPAAADYELRWLGVAQNPRGEKVALRDVRIKVDPLRRSPARIRLAQLRSVLSKDHAGALATALTAEVTALPDELGDSVITALRSLHPRLASLLDFLETIAQPDLLDSARTEDRSWQEQSDATRTGLQIGGFPPSLLAAWRRPADRHAPFLAGIVREPTEQSLIEHDVAHSLPGPRIFEVWEDPDTGELESDFRCDIHVFEHRGRRIEVVNVNASEVENRTGTDLIYYHVATQSLTLVQYKRLPALERWVYANKQLLGQLDRLEAVANLSRQPIAAHEWRLSNDACFLKLAYWPEDRRADPNGPAPGMILPLSYVRLLLQDDCTLGPGDGRRLGYGYADRHLVHTQFIELVKHGLTGTVGTTRDEVIALAKQRAREGNSVAIAAELAYGEPGQVVRERQQRARSRGPEKKPKPKRPTVPSGQMSFDDGDEDTSSYEWPS
ncbi:hypothetical protein [Streptomyces sp. NBC_01233]|uniref:hypothetical protein n=1 Tax=Streptomyces sp. NBC_01233 TaxID=2903787 RepID=UPI002E0EE85A|nr:hypothetical protein OG332_11580 [Streptomyces sp. NBC_01233]